MATRKSPQLTSTVPTDPQSIPPHDSSEMQSVLKSLIRSYAADHQERYNADLLNLFQGINKHNALGLTEAERRVLGSRSRRPHPVRPTGFRGPRPASIPDLIA